MGWYCIVLNCIIIFVGGQSSVDWVLSRLYCTFFPCKRDFDLISGAKTRHLGLHLHLHLCICLPLLLSSPLVTFPCLALSSPIRPQRIILSYPILPRPPYPTVPYASGKLTQKTASQEPRPRSLTLPNRSRPTPQTACHLVQVLV